MKILIAIPLLLIAYGLLAAASWIGEKLEQRLDIHAKLNHERGVTPWETPQAIRKTQSTSA